MKKTQLLLILLCISYAFINSNYQNQANPQTLIQHLQATKK